MMKSLLFLFFLFSSSVAAEPLEVRISERDCVAFTAVPADWQPDPHVVPADLNTGVSMDLPNFLNRTFTVYFDLKKDFRFWNSDLDFDYLPVAVVEIKDGQIFVNGSPVSQYGEETLKKACEARINDRKIDKNNLTAVQ